MLTGRGQSLGGLTVAPPSSQTKFRLSQALKSAERYLDLLLINREIKRARSHSVHFFGDS